MTRALIADDEPLLSDALARALAQAWPDLEVVAQAAAGDEALDLALQLRPQVCFLDVRMPGLSGLEVALALADEWPEADAAHFPLIVFVTAYDEYALAAFNAQASDYLLKPVEPQRLAVCVQRLQARLTQGQGDAGLADSLLQLAQGFERLQAQAHPSGTSHAPTPPRLTVLQAGLGNNVHLVPVADVLVIEASDRYLRVLTADAEHLLRMPLHELRQRLDSEEFWQIHRSVLVRASAMRKLERDAGGKLRLHLKGRPEVWPVGRVFAAQFAAM